MIKRSFFVAFLLASAAMPAAAQDIATRIFQMEERIRQLTGQVEELNFTVQQLQKQLGQKGDVGDAAAPPPQRRALAEAAPSEGGVEVIQDVPAQKAKSLNAEVLGAESADGTAQELLPFKKAEQTDGSFEGQVVVPENGEQAALPGQPVQSDGVQQQDGIEQVSLQPEETPDTLYKSANEALLRRQFPDAEAGFRSFLAKYSDHALAGSAQYWLGETFYQQGEVKQAAQNFLEAYKKYPKSRRAPDSLLKLGMSLNKMGQKEQACAALNSVATEFPRAVEAKKRATTEYNRAGC
jgi:tol-pal system protein YbgF